MHCPLCFNENNELYHRDKIRSYQRCLVCELVFVSPEYYLTAKNEKARYDLHQNNPNDEGYKQFLSQLVLPMLTYLKAGDFGLDFGSGPEPALATLFRSHNYSIKLYDPFYVKNPELLDGQYNFITATEVVEHLHHPATVFNKLVEMLSSKGILGIMTKTLPSQKTFSSWWYKNDFTHVCFYSDTTFGWIAKKWKLEIEYQQGDVMIFRKQ